MSKRKRQSRAEPISPMVAWYMDSGDGSCVPGYTKLSDNPEVHMGIERIAELISNMTIHLMKNTEKGDVRVKNELSRKVDINPFIWMTRQLWMQWIVKTMLLEGNSFVYPNYDRQGMLLNLMPLPGCRVDESSTESLYTVIYGQKT